MHQAHEPATRAALVEAMRFAAESRYAYAAWGEELFSLLAALALGETSRDDPATRDKLEVLLDRAAKRLDSCQSPPLRQAGHTLGEFLKPKA